MPRLFRVSDDETIGQITTAQKQFLVEMLEEDEDEDQHYFINQDTLELFEGNNCDPELLALLESAIEDGEDGVDVGWE
jgi:hypothetical protein